jgi:hypothetical protein
LEAIEFEVSARLKRIGERAFSGSGLHSVAIPASTEEIDGSAFADCPLFAIQVAPGSLNFKVERNLLLTADGTEIVRYFGLHREIVVGRRVKNLRKSSFEGCRELDRIDFEIGAELERIGPAALRDCVSLVSIEIPASVKSIEEAAFERCTELESCLMDRESSLVTIGARAFANCTSLRSFSIPRQVAGIGSECFTGCIYLSRLEFMSSESLKRVIGDLSLDCALDTFAVNSRSGLFRIDVNDGQVELIFAGWARNPVCGAGGDLHLSLVQDIQ